MTKYILAHDLGTSGNKAALFSQNGKMIGFRTFSYDTDYFNGNWAEQNSGDWWKAVCETTKKILTDYQINNEDISVVSFSGQMMGCLCVDRNGIPLRKAIIWADQRAKRQEMQLQERISPSAYYKITGHRNSASYGLHKFMWIRDNEPEIYENTYKILNAKDYIVFCLTGHIYTDYTDATGNNCFDINTQQWSQQIIEYSGIDISKLPEIKPSTFVAGGVTAKAAQVTGLKEGTPVVLGGGDGLCANIGAGSYKVGRTFSYVGSSSWIATTSEKPLFDEEMRTITWAHVVPGLYSPNGTMQTAGGAYSWIKDTICTYENELAIRNRQNVYEIINKEAMQSKPGANGIVFLPYLLGERSPRWNPEAQGAFIGLKMQNNRNDIIRSVLEGITFNLSIILDILRKQVDIKEMLVIGGGAKGSVWRQIMADVYNVEIKVPALLEEATSLGAAVTGGVGIGLFKDFDVIDSLIDIECSHYPNPDYLNVYTDAKRIFEECYFALQDVYSSMTQIYKNKNSL